MTPFIPLPAPAGKFVPHEGPMRLIDSLLSADGETGRAEVHIRDNHLLLNEDGTLDGVVFPELVAQTYAAIRGFELRTAGKPLQPGYLVGVQKCEALGRPKAGDVLLVAAETVGKFSGFAVVEGEVRCNDRVLATAKIKLFIPSEAEENEDS
nr:3-hydroxylacyl-ACP dehydratase [Pseudodesulfovibrio sp.]